MKKRMYSTPLIGVEQIELKGALLEVSPGLPVPPPGPFVPGPGRSYAPSPAIKTE